MTLQLQLNLNEGGEELSEEEDGVFTHRLSRVVTKLFARVIRAEEGTGNPYTHEQLDMEALLCAAEDYLLVCQRAEEEGTAPSAEAVEICTDMVKSLIISILDSHGNSELLRRYMQNADIRPTDSAFGEMLSACEDELGLSLSNRPPTEIEVTSSPNSSNPRQPRTPSRDVAQLVSKLGSAQAGEERQAALEEIRRYKSANGDEEIRAHLQQLSGPFREFIEEQLNEVNDSDKPNVTGTGTSSVSERIRNLRSRLQVTEMAVQNAVEEKSGSPPLDSTGTAAPARTLSPSGRSGSAKPQSRLAAPTPSRLASPPPSKLPTPISHSRVSGASNASSSQALRERLAARREGDSTTRAAALRARLEAVKQQSQQNPH